MYRYLNGRYMGRTWSLAMGIQLPQKNIYDLRETKSLLMNILAPSSTEINCEQ